MRLAISGEGLGSAMPLAQVLTEIKKVGVNAIELWPENVPVQEGVELFHKRLYLGRDLAAAKRILDENGIETACVAFGAAFDKALTKNKNGDLFAVELARAVEAADTLGAKLVNLYCYHICMDDTPNLNVLHRYFDKGIAEAERTGVTIVLENEAHDCTKNPLQMLEAVKGMNSPNFRTNYDSTNYYQAGFEPYPYAYEVLRDVIAYVHIKNGCVYRPEHGHKEEFVGGACTGALAGEHIYYPTADDGAVNIEGLLHRLTKDGYNGFCTLEPHTTPEQCIRYYKDETRYLYGTGFFQPETPQLTGKTGL